MGYSLKVGYLNGGPGAGLTNVKNGVTNRCSDAYLFCVLSKDFQGERDCSQSRLPVELCSLIVTHFLCQILV